MNDDLQPASDLTYVAFLPSAAPRSGERSEAPRSIPELFAGRYRIERLLGVGGMGAVYLARDLLAEQFADPEPYLALKTLNDDFAEYPDANMLLYSEFALTTRLRHPHIVRLFNFAVDHDSQRAFITMERLKGPTLDEMLCEHPQGLPWPMLREVSIALLEALSYSHATGILHGDLKPGNIILTDEGLRLFDYGLGQGIDSQLSRLPVLSRKRIAAWTPRYAALELIDGGPLSAATDLYAVACVLAELANGKHPYRRLSARQAKNMQLDRQLQRPERLPEHCWNALRTALAFEERQRCIDCQELLEAFRQPDSPQPRRRWFSWLR